MSLERIAHQIDGEPRRREQCVTKHYHQSAKKGPSGKPQAEHRVRNGRPTAHEYGAYVCPQLQARYRASPQSPADCGAGTSGSALLALAPSRGRGSDNRVAGTGPGETQLAQSYRATSCRPALIDEQYARFEM